MRLLNPLKERIMFFGLINPKPIHISYQTAKIYVKSGGVVPQQLRKLCHSTMALNTSDNCISVDDPHQVARQEIVNEWSDRAILVTMRGIPWYAVVIHGRASEGVESLQLKVATLIGRSAIIFDDIRMEYIQTRQ
jgi:hypothetical protein